MEKRISSSATAESVARKWIDTLDSRSQWRIEVLSRRVRRRSDGKALPGRKELPLRIRRFAEGCPPAQMRAAMDYLLSKAPYSDIVLNGEKLPGAYRPTLTEWRRDRGNVVHGPSRDASDATYTLVQDLVDASMDDALPLGTMSNCTQEESTEWTWDAGFVQDLPEPEQGVTWSIQGVRRNEDGTIDYALVKRRAITQHTPRTASKDDAVVKVETESWMNLYGSPDEGFRDHTGATIAVPEAGEGVEVKMRESDDCTYSVRATYSSPKSVATDRSSSHTIYEGKHSGTGKGEHVPLPNAPDASNGVIYGHDSSLQPDGTYVNKTDVTVERPVPSAVVTVTKGRRGLRTERESRNQQNAIGTAVGLGGMVRVERTPGGRYNNVIRTWSLAARLPVGEACRKTEFQHVHAETVSGVRSIPTSHVSRANGTTVKRTTDMDDEGSITQTTETTTEIYVPKHVESWTVGLTGLVHRTKSASETSAGTKPRYSKATIGSSVTNTLTEGGRYDVEKVEVDRTGSKVDIEAGCRKTVFEHRHLVATADPRGTLSTGSHESAGGGVVRESETRLREDGTAVTTDTVTTELSQPAAVKRIHKTAKAIVTTVTDRNVAATAATPRVGGTEEHTMTDGGLYNHTVTTTVPTGATDYAASRNDAFETSQTVQTTGSGAPSAELGAAGAGLHTKIVSTLDDNGIVSTNVETVTEKQVTLRQSGRRDRHVSETVAVKRGFTESSELTNTGDHWSSALTQGGMSDLETVTRTIVDGSPDTFVSEEDLFSSVKTTQTIQGALDAAVGGEAAEGPSNGTTHAVREVRDETGVVSKYDTETREKPVANAVRRATSTHFTKTKVVSNRSSQADSYEDKEFVEAGGDMVTVEVARTKGDAYDVTTTTVTPKERVWEEPTVEYTRLYRRALHFRNLEEGKASRKIRDVIDEFERKLQNWFTKDDGTRAPTSYDVQPTMTLNDFGLYDGGVVAWARWPNESAGTDGSASCNFLWFDYWEVSMKESTSRMPNGKLHVTRVVVKRKHQYKNARGVRDFMNFMVGKEVFEGSGFSFVPSTGTYHYNLVTQVEEAKKDKVYDAS